MRDDPLHSNSRGPAAPPDAAGRAFGWSLLALLLILLGTGLLFFKSMPAGNPSFANPPGEAAAKPANFNLVPEARFKDITADAGIHFIHVNGAYGQKFLPETMGGGCAFFDYDADGKPDILFVNSTYWPSHQPEGTNPPTMALYHNEGGGAFRDVTAGSGLDVSFYGMGVAVGDYDNDGLPDVFITAVGGNQLFHNEGFGKFKRVTRQAGVGGSPSGWSTSAAWIDYDNDGDLDLFVCNYIRWSPEIDLQINYQLAGIGRAYGPPMNFAGSFPSLYRNDGHGQFTDVSAQSRLEIKNQATGLPLGKSLGVAPVDLDNDGWIDLIVANDTVQNFIFHNERNGTFKEIGALTGAALDSFGKARGAMGIDAARIQENNRLAISIGNFANEMTAFYVSQQDPLTFTDEAIARGIGAASRPFLTFGVFFFDYDLDGWLDLLTANGHIEEEIAKTQHGQRYAQPAQLYWNGAGSREPMGFVPVPPGKAGEDLFKPMVGRGSAFADIDGDGDLDLLLTQINGPPMLLRNDQKLNHHWVRFKLVGTRCNRDAIGAWIKVRAGQRILWRQVMPARGYLSQSELPVTIGLGNQTRVDEVTIFWPGGGTQKVDPINIDAPTLVKEAP